MQTAKPEDVGFSSTRLQRIDTVMQGYIDRGELAGLITVVARRGQAVHFACLGMMDIEAGKPMRPDAIFRIYSMTKPIVSVALMILYEEGHFLLGDPVSRFIPEFKELKVLQEGSGDGRTLVDLEREVTIHDLLIHTAGLANVGTRLDLTLEEVVHELARRPLVRQPGAKWQYSQATDVVAHLVELVSGRSFDTFLTDRIFRPLGMVDTGFYVPQDNLDRFTALYRTSDEGGLELADPPATGKFSTPPRLLSGAGGLVSTIADYFRFCQMLFNGGTLDGTQLLGRKTVELMTRNHLPDAMLPLEMDPATTALLAGHGFGLGFMVLVDVVRSQAPGTVGQYWFPAAGGTRFFIDPREELIGIIMPQLWQSYHYARFEALIYQALVD